MIDSENTDYQYSSDASSLMPSPPQKAKDAERAVEIQLLIDDLTISYDGKAVVHHVGFELEAGDIGCLLGPSGCGKSTILRAIAGFEPAATGSIHLNQELISSQSKHLNPEQRNIGMVFQDFALFPHLTVANIAFGLRNWSKSAQKQRIISLLELVGLSDFADRYPHSLSGGQQQRVALARAIAPKPSILLMDEPFSSLDVEMRQQLVPEVRRILQHENITGILVTHDQLEAFGMADQIAVMESGRIEQWDTGYNLYHKPATKFVADFIGQGEFIRATVEDECSVSSVLGVLTSREQHGFSLGQHVEVLIRPDDVLHDDDSKTYAEILSKQFRGSHFLYRVKLPSGQKLFCFTPSHHNHNIGEPIGIDVNVDHLVMFATNGDVGTQNGKPQAVAIDAHDAHVETE